MTELCKSCLKQNFCNNDMTDTYCSGYRPRIDKAIWQTNEKWFATLSTEEKAKVISRLDCYHGNVYEIEQWLKEVHKA